MTPTDASEALKRVICFFLGHQWEFIRQEAPMNDYPMGWYRDWKCDRCKEEKRTA
jgi:hypothetical protein